MRKQADVSYWHISTANDAAIILCKQIRPH